MPALVGAPPISGLANRYAQGPAHRRELKTTSQDTGAEPEVMQPKAACKHPGRVLTTQDVILSAILKNITFTNDNRAAGAIIVCESDIF